MLYQFARRPGDAPRVEYRPEGPISLPVGRSRSEDRIVTRVTTGHKRLYRDARQQESLAHATGERVTWWWRGSRSSSGIHDTGLTLP